MEPLVVVGIAIVVLFFFAGVRIVRPTHRALVERLGKYHHFASFGFNWIIPVSIGCLLSTSRRR